MPYCGAGVSSGPQARADYCARTAAHLILDDVSCSLLAAKVGCVADDFSEQVKKALALRAGGHCSNPDCRVLTSGPKEDPAKAVNLGVGAHIRAASPGGPRYDAELTPEERCSPTNGIWLCQNCAKLIDNDPQRFPVELLLSWKNAAEESARDHVGKTPLHPRSPLPELKLNAKVRIEPMIPRLAVQPLWTLQSVEGGVYLFLREDTVAGIGIPATFIEKYHSFGTAGPGLLELAGRLQWISTRQVWEICPEKPASGPEGEYGLGKSVDFDFPRRAGLQGNFGWSRQDKLPLRLSQGRFIFYDGDGKYLRVTGPDVDQILISDSQ